MERKMVSDVDKIYQLWEDYGRTLNEGDLEGWLSLWEDDGVQMAPEAPQRVGVDEIQSATAPMLAAFDIRGFTVEPDEVKVLGDRAYSHGSYEMTMVPKEAGEPIEVVGKFLTILAKQVDGSWKIAIDCFNSSKPAD